VRREHRAVPERHSSPPVPLSLVHGLCSRQSNRSDFLFSLLAVPAETFPADGARARLLKIDLLAVLFLLLHPPTGRSSYRRRNEMLPAYLSKQNSRVRAHTNQSLTFCGLFLVFAFESIIPGSESRVGHSFPPWFFALSPLGPALYLFLVPVTDLPAPPHSFLLLV